MQNRSVFGIRSKDRVPPARNGATPYLAIVLGLLSSALFRAEAQTVATVELSATKGSIQPQKTSATISLSNDAMNVRFSADDKDVIVQEEKFSDRDRVSILFSNDVFADPCYAVEVDASGRARQVSIEAFSPSSSDDVPEGTQCSSQFSSDGFELNVSIPFALLSRFLNRPVDAHSTLFLSLMRFDVSRSSVSRLDEQAIYWIRPCPAGSGLYHPSIFRQVSIDSQIPAAVTESHPSKQMRLAMEQIRSDWNRYLRSRELFNKTERWFDSLPGYPSPEEDWLDFDSTTRGARSHDLGSVPTQLANQRFTLRMGNLRREQKTLPPTERHELANIQSEDGETLLSISTFQNRIFVSVGSRQRYGENPMELCTSENVRLSDLDSLTVTNPGTGFAEDIRLWIDNAPVPCIPLVCCFNESRPIDTTRKKVDAMFHFENNWEGVLQLYRETLTGIELLSLTENAKLTTWVEMKDSMKALWVEHFATRIDNQGGYLQESLLHYARSRQNETPEK